MKNYSGDRREGGFNKGGDRGGFQKKAWSNDRPAQMHKATCAECGKVCEVPFRPDGSKPVYCNDCFNKKRDPSDTRGSRDYGAPKSNFNDRFGSRPAYADRSDARPAFNDRAERPAYKPAADNSGKQLAEISTKLDRLIEAIAKMQSQSAPKPSVAAPVPAEKVSLAETLKKVSKPTTVSKPKTVAKKAAPKVAKKKIAAKKK